MRQLACLVVSVAALVNSSSIAQAQAPVRRTWSPSSTLSPWLNLFRSDSGVLDPYNSLVRPRLELQDRLRRQQLGLDRQAAGLAATRQQMIQSSGQMPIRPTGASSVFMNYSHYYPGFQGGRAGAVPRAGARGSWSPRTNSAYRHY